MILILVTNNVLLHSHDILGITAVFLYIFVWIFGEILTRTFLFLQKYGGPKKLLANENLTSDKVTVRYMLHFFMSRWSCSELYVAITRRSNWEHT